MTAKKPARVDGEPARPRQRSAPGAPMAAQYSRIAEVHDQLADAALRGVGPAELTTAYAALVGRTIVLLDAAFTPRAQAGAVDGSPTWSQRDPSVARLMQALAGERRPLRVPAVPGSLLSQGFLVAPIVVEDRPLGYLLVLDDVSGQSMSDDLDLLTTTYAAPLFALTLAHERTSTELGLRYRRAVVEALLSGHFVDTDDARQKARAAGLAAAPFCVALLRIADDTGAPAGARLADRLAAGLSGDVVGPIAVVRDGAVVALVPDDVATDPRRLIVDVLRRNGGTGRVRAGLSEPTTVAEHAPAAYRQAEQAAEMGARVGHDDPVVSYEDLGIYRLLLRIGNETELWRYADDVLGAIIAYDDERQLDLLPTLSEYLRCKGSMKHAGERLHVHANTVAYRVRRIEVLTGLNLADPDDRLAAHVAVKIVEYYRPPPRVTHSGPG